MGMELRCPECFCEHEVPFENIEWMGGDPFYPQLCSECCNRSTVASKELKVANILKYGPMETDEERRA